MPSYTVVIVRTKTEYCKIVVKNAKDEDHAAETAEQLANNFDLPNDVIWELEDETFDCGEVDDFQEDADADLPIVEALK